MATHSRPSKFRFAAATLTALVAAALFTLAAAPKAGAVVQLNWTQTKVYNTAAPAGTDRTWLGYLTRAATPPAPPASAPDGTAAPSAGLAGPTVSSSSTVGDDYTWTFDANSGSLDATTLAGTLDFTGKLTYSSTNHGILISVTDPKIVLAGNGTGKLYATGDKSTSATYDQTEPVFNLDLSKATCTLGWDGTLTLGNIAPSIAVEGYAFPGGAQGYAAGSGPERTPNTFGTFSLSGATCAPLTGPAGPAGAQGATGAQGPAGPQGEKGKDATVKTIKLKKSIFKTKKKVLARVTKKGKFVGYAEVTGKKIKITSITSTLKGTYKFTAVSGKKRTARVKLG